MARGQCRLALLCGAALPVARGRILARGEWNILLRFFVVRTCVARTVELVSQVVLAAGVGARLHRFLHARAWLLVGREEDGRRRLLADGLRVLLDLLHSDSRLAQSGRRRRARLLRARRPLGFRFGFGCLLVRSQRPVLVVIVQIDDFERCLALHASRGCHSLRRRRRCRSLAAEDATLRDVLGEPGLKQLGALDPRLVQRLKRMLLELSLLALAGRKRRRLARGPLTQLARLAECRRAVEELPALGRVPKRVPLFVAVAVLDEHRVRLRVDALDLALVPRVVTAPVEADPAAHLRVRILEPIPRRAWATRVPAVAQRTKRTLDKPRAHRLVLPFFRDDHVFLRVITWLAFIVVVILTACNSLALLRDVLLVVALLCKHLLGLPSRFG